jgi:hypothetical protein
MKTSIKLVILLHTLAAGVDGFGDMFDAHDGDGLEETCEESKQ